MKSFTALRTAYGNATLNKSTDNYTYGMTLVNDSLRYLTSKYYLNEASYTVPGGTVAGTSTYQIPFNIKEFIDFTITVGNIKYTLKEAPSRVFFDKLTTVPYSSDIPMYFFRYQGLVNVYPTPASSGNTITMNFKRRIKDLSIADSTTGTAAVTNGSTTITITGGALTNYVNANDLWIQIAAPLGDNEWYQVLSVVSGTGVITLYNQYEGVTGSGLSFTLGEMPLLPEDYQDLPVYRAANIYFTANQPDAQKALLYKNLYDEGFAKLNAEFGAKTASVAIGNNEIDMANPNLYVQQGQ